MVPGERKLELALTVVRNYTIVYHIYAPANLSMAGPKAPSRWLITIRNWGRAVPELGYHVGQISHWLKLF